MKATIRDVGMAAYYLDNLKKYKKKYDEYPSTFKLRGSISSNIMEIPLNDIIKIEIEKFFTERMALNQKIIDENPDIVKIIEENNY